MAQGYTIPVSDVLISPPLLSVDRKGSLLRFFQYVVFKVRVRTLSTPDQRSVHRRPSSSRANGDGEIRTLDPLLARQVLSQLSYAPTGSYSLSMGLSGLEPPTSRLSGVRSNRLSYKPFF